MYMFALIKVNQACGKGYLMMMKTPMRRKCPKPLDKVQPASHPTIHFFEPKK
jgi:hypothetical protein